MTTLEIIMFVAPLVIGFGTGFIANRRQGDTPAKAALDTIVELLEKYLARDLDGNGQVGRGEDAPDDAAPVEPGGDRNRPLLDIIHRLLDREDKK